jgi:hypothetical protein
MSKLYFDDQNGRTEKSKEIKGNLIDDNNNRFQASQSQFYRDIFEETN